MSRGANSCTSAFVALLQVGMSKSNIFKVLDYLAKQPDLTVAAEDLYDLMRITFHQRESACVRRLIAKAVAGGVNLNEADSQSDTLLMSAARVGNLVVVTALVSAGAYVR